MKDTETPLRDTIATWLQDQGHHAIVEVRDERYAEVCFRTRGLRFRVRVDEHDPGFLYLLLIVALPDDVADELTARRATATIESNAKVLKTELLWDARRLILAAEQLVEEPGGPAIFWRTVALLEKGFFGILSAFNEEAGRAAASRFVADLEVELADHADVPPSSLAEKEDAL